MNSCWLGIPVWSELPIILNFWFWNNDRSEFLIILNFRSFWIRKDVMWIFQISFESSQNLCFFFYFPFIFFNSSYEYLFICSFWISNHSESPLLNFWSFWTSDSDFVYFEFLIILNSQCFFFFLVYSELFRFWFHDHSQFLTILNLNCSENLLPNLWLFWISKYSNDPLT